MKSKIGLQLFYVKQTFNKLFNWFVFHQNQIKTKHYLYYSTYPVVNCKWDYCLKICSALYFLYSTLSMPMHLQDIPSPCTSVFNTLSQETFFWMGCFGIHRIPKYKYLLMMAQQKPRMWRYYISFLIHLVVFTHWYMSTLLFEIGDLLLISRHLLCASMAIIYLI